MHMFFILIENKMAMVSCFRRSNFSATGRITRLIHNHGLNPKEMKKDVIGPADPVSNLRPILFRIPEKESELEKKLRLKREEIQKWNQEFWATHNNNFLKQKRDFVNSLSSDEVKAKEKKALTSEEMSEFYKDFLDNHWEVHLTYNKEWYKRNLDLLFLTYRVKCNNLLKKLISF
ncbi:hypothetical protein J437_LFUL017790 [Ladona fulva]|uniref:Apoptogenic protein 1, mitochondrial n=1 Tax=Ladona fulva TaxID=123851 RepID=A0A8K0KQ00_LADFU|nr:hypothetical protein J437_LFUL017790 [Ladona fulva]